MPRGKNILTGVVLKIAQKNGTVIRSRLYSSISTSGPVDLPPPRLRPTYLSLLNPFADLVYLIESEPELHARVSGFASTVSLMMALMCGVSGGVVFQAALADSTDNDSPDINISKPNEDNSSCLIALPFQSTPVEISRSSLKSALHGFLCSSFCFNVQGLVTSTLLLAAINSTPTGHARAFVLAHSMLISSCGWWLVPGMLAMSAAAGASVPLLFADPQAAQLALLASGSVITSTVYMGLSLLGRNHQMRSHLIRNLTRAGKSK